MTKHAQGLTDRPRCTREGCTSYAYDLERKLCWTHAWTVATTPRARTFQDAVEELQRVERDLEYMPRRSQLTDFLRQRYRVLKAEVARLAYAERRESEVPW
jgi:hypothetical protein